MYSGDTCGPYRYSFVVGTSVDRPRVLSHPYVMDDNKWQEGKTGSLWLHGRVAPPLSAAPVRPPPTRRLGLVVSLPPLPPVYDGDVFGVDVKETEAMETPGVVPYTERPSQKVGLVLSRILQSEICPEEPSLLPPPCPPP